MTCISLVRGCNSATLLVAIVAVAGCNKSAPAASRQPAIPVETAHSVQISAPVEITANGVVEPLQSVSVEAQVGGMLTEVAFKEGDAVARGQLLFRLDPRPFQASLRQAQAVLARDEAQAANARRDAERYRTLVAKDYVTKSQADQAEATAAALRATLVSDSSAVETARLNLAYATITAPIAGRTGSLLVKQGNIVKSAGDAARRDQSDPANPGPLSDPAARLREVAPPRRAGRRPGDRRRQRQYGDWRRRHAVVSRQRRRLAHRDRDGESPIRKRRQRPLAR